MKKQYLEAGKIVNTHGLNGDVKVQPWCDSAEFLCGFRELFYENGDKISAIKSRVHKNVVIMRIDGIDSIDMAEGLVGRVLYINRADVNLDGRVFIQDIIGMKVYDKRGDRELGVLDNVLSMPRHDVYSVMGDREYLIPAIPPFLKDIDIDRGVITVETIEGMADDN